MALLAVLAAALVSAEKAGELVILRNVVLPSTTDDSKGKQVAVRIEDDSLTRVTEDAVTAEDGARVYDAKRGYLMGGLTLNVPATLLLVDGNTHQNHLLLLDISRHASFAVWSMIFTTKH